MKQSEVIKEALSAWRPVESATDLAHDTFALLDEEEVQRLAFRAHTDGIRAALRRKTKGVPQYASVTRRDASGSVERVYKQTALFTVDDYRIAIESYVREANANLRVAQALARNCAVVHGVQLPIPGFDREAGAA